MFNSQKKSQKQTLSPLVKDGSLNCVDIRFYKGSGKSDPAAAKKAFEWCKKNFIWFSEETPFVLESNRISWNSEVRSGKINYNQIPLRECKENSVREWIWEMGKKTGSSVIAAEFISVNKECSWEQYYTSILYKKRRAEIFLQYNFDSISMGSFVFYGDKNNSKALKTQVFNLETHSFYRGKFRHKTNGEEILAGGIFVEKSSDKSKTKWKWYFEIGDDGTYLYDKNNECQHEDRMEINLFNYDHFDKKLRLFEGMFEEMGYYNADDPGDTELSHWEFLGFATEKGVFESVEN